MKVPSSGVFNYPFFMGNGGTAQLAVRVQSSGGLYVSLPGGTGMAGGTVVANTWHHIAISRSNGATLGLFFDGVQVYSAVNSVVFAACAVVAIGAVPANSWYSSNMCLDDIRISNTIGRYDASFTPPVARSVPYAARVSGTVRDDAGLPCAREVRVYARSTGAKAGAATSDPTTGEYTANLLWDWGECNAVILDDAAGTTYNDLIHRAVCY